MSGENLGQLIDLVLDIVRDPSYRTVGIAASGTITVTDLPSVADTFQVHDQLFTFKLARAVAGEVTIGASVTECCVNIALAINIDLGTNFTATATAITVVVAAKYVGESWNTVVFSTTATDLTVTGSGFFTGGSYGNKIQDKINQAVADVSERILLPALSTRSTLTSDTTISYVAMPEDFQRNVLSVWNETAKEEVRTYLDVETLLYMAGSNRDEAGQIIGAALDLTTEMLHYQHINATAQSLVVTYHKKPALMASLTDVPACIPADYRRALIVPRACALIFAEIEDGWEQKKVDTAYYLGQYEDGITSLRRYILSLVKHTRVRRTNQWI